MKKPAKPATAKGKMVKPVKAWLWQGRDGITHAVNFKPVPHENWIRGWIVPAKGYTVTPAGGRGAKR